MKMVITITINQLLVIFIKAFLYVIYLLSSIHKVSFIIQSAVYVWKSIQMQNEGFWRGGQEITGASGRVDS